jgi:hypothetical protein
MNLLYPSIPRGRLVPMIRIAAFGAAVAAAYGSLHDQISYTISSEYFTKLKFAQFAFADFGWPRRAFVAEVGVLATWWVGMIAGWVLARIGFADPTAPSTRRDTVRAFAIVMGVAVIAGVVGALLGSAVSRGDVSGWNEWRDALGLHDVRAFVVVAYLHWASYLGAVIGLTVAVVDARRKRHSPRRHGEHGGADV